VVAGPLALSIRLVKNRLRVESKPAVL